MPGNIDSVVARYAGTDGPSAAPSRPISDTPGLKGKLSELAGQLSSVQQENDAIRARYLELEDAWQGMIEENKALHGTNNELRNQLQAEEKRANEAKEMLEGAMAENAALKAQVDALTASEAKAVADLKEEQLILGKKNIEVDLLRRECMSFDMEGRRLREDWDDKVYKLSKAEEARDHYKSELNKLAGQYGDLVEKLSFVVMDYQVRTSTTQVKTKEGGTELLSTYLNKVYDEQEAANAKYAQLGMINRQRLGAVSPSSLAAVNVATDTVPLPVNTTPLMPTLLSPSAEAVAVARAAAYNSVAASKWTERVKVQANNSPKSPNGRVAPKNIEQPAGKPGWNKY